jgi:hypothetical protein
MVSNCKRDYEFSENKITTANKSFALGGLSVSRPFLELG